MSSSQEPTANLPSASEVQRRADEEHWRREVASRVQQHRARRRRRFDPNASFEFDFPSDSALTIAPPLETQQTQVMRLKQRDDAPLLSARDALKADALRRPRNVIRFPRYAAPDTASLLDEDENEDELDLTVPVTDSVRILDAPEPQQLELLPAFPDIHLDEEHEDLELAAPNRDMDLPPQPAPLLLRVFSAAIDLAVLLLAGGLSAAVFFELAGGFPSWRLALPYVLIVCGGFWCILQYIFLVYGRGTPGMSVAGVEVSTFAGQPANVRARRSRVFAATLSTLSIGLGFLWAFVDEDTLGWHDRISETYLKSCSQHSAISTQPQR